MERLLPSWANKRSKATSNQVAPVLASQAIKVNGGVRLEPEVGVAFSNLECLSGKGIEPDTSRSLILKDFDTSIPGKSSLLEMSWQRWQFPERLLSSHDVPMWNPSCSDSTVSSRHCSHNANSILLCRCRCFAPLGFVVIIADLILSTIA